MKKNLFFILLCILCSCKNEKTMPHHNASYIIDIDTIERKDTLYTSTIFKSVRHIILEEHDYAIIGHIDAIQTFDDYLFILDIWKANKLFVFDRKTGKYIRQLGSMGNGPGEYIRLRDFCFDFEKREIYLLDDWGKKIFKYNLDNGDYIGSIQLPDDITYEYVVYIDNKLYLSIFYYYSDINDNMLLEFDIKTGKYKDYLSASQYNLGWDRPYYTDFKFFISNDVPPKFVKLFMNTIISIDKDSIYPYFTLKSKDWVKKEDLLSEEELIEREEDQLNFINKKNRTVDIHSYLEWKEYIYMEYFHGFDLCYILYNKETKEIYHYNFVKNDKLFSNGILYQKFLFANSKFAYDYLNYGRMSIFVEDIKLNKIEFSPYLENQDELMNLSEENFVIFEYEFK